ncbi:MAG: phosphoribosylglycinamide formyltransferase [Mycoplasmatales bacterium]
MQLVIMASGDGSNFEAIAKACQSGQLKATVKLLICDKEDVNVLKRAQKYNIKTEIVLLKNFTSKQEYEKKIVKLIKKENPDLICLAGYMKIINETILQAYEGKIINIHPSLLPQYKGKDAVYNALANQEVEIGATVHYVNQYIDDGRIIDQIKFNIAGLTEVEVFQKLHTHEHLLYIRVLKQFYQNKNN